MRSRVAKRGVASLGAGLAFAMLAAAASALGHSPPERQVVDDLALRPLEAAALPQGRILLLAELPGEPGGAVLAELEADGSIDRAFGMEGFANLGRSVFSAAWGDRLTVDRQGRILVISAGSSVTRFLPSGALDTSFGESGTAAVDLGFGSGDAHSLAVASNGEILVGGAAVKSCSFLCTMFPAVARLHEDGSPDLSFGREGHELFLSPHQEEESSVLALTTGPRGEIYVAAGGGVFREIYRLRANGSVDRSFGTRGEILIHMSGPTPVGSRTRVWAVPQIEVTRAGKIVVVGSLIRTSRSGHAFSTMVALRYRADGRPDRSFGRFGHVIVDFGMETESSSFAVRKKGGVVVAGTGLGKPRYFALASLRPDGSLDPRFAQGGLAKVRLRSSGWETGLLLQDRQAVAIGYINEPTPVTPRALLARIPLFG